MTCPKCGLMIGDSEIGCRNCAQRASLAAAQRGLPVFVADIQRNRFELLLRRKARTGWPEHIAIPQYEDAALCGADLREMTFSRRALYRELPEAMCPECERSLEQLFKALPHMVVGRKTEDSCEHLQGGGHKK